MPWQCRRNTLLAEARAERDIPISLDDRAEAIEDPANAYKWELYDVTRDRRCS